MALTFMRNLEVEKISWYIPNEELRLIRRYEKLSNFVRNLIIDGADKVKNVCNANAVCYT